MKQERQKVKKKKQAALYYLHYDKQLHKNYTLYVICCFEQDEKEMKEIMCGEEVSTNQVYLQVEANLFTPKLVCTERKEK